MGEDNYAFKEFHIINAQTGEEMPCEPIQELKESLSMITDGADITGAINQFKQATTQFAFDLIEFSKSINQFKRLFGDYPITKKRTRKLLMAHGYDRNGANRHIECMRYRTLREVESRYLK